MAKSATTRESDAGSDEMDAAEKDPDTSTTGDAKIEEDEEQLKTDFVVPQASEAFIFIPNPDNHCVTVIDGKSLIKPQDEIAKCVSCKGDKVDQCVGNNPTYLGVDPSEDTAIVIDKGTKYAAVIQKSRATESVNRFEVVKGANTARFAPGGNYAIVYYDPEYVGDPEEAGSNQEVTVVLLKNLGSEDDKDRVATNRVVGLHPRDLVFQSDGKKAFFVTDDGISVIDFTAIENGDDDGSGIAVTVDFKGLLDPAEARIAIAPGGGYALGFIPGSDEIFRLDITVAYDRLETAESVSKLNMKDFYRKTGENGGNGNNGNGGNGANGSDDDAGQTSPVYDFDEDEDKIDPRPELPEDVIPGIADVAMSPPLDSGSFVIVTIPNPGLVLKMNVPKVFITSKDVLDEVDFYLIGEEYDRVEISSTGDKAWLYNHEEKSLRTVVLDLAGDPPPAMLDEEWDNWAYNHIRHINVAHPISRAESLSRGDAIVAFHEPNSALSSTTRGTGYTILNLGRAAARFWPTPNPIRSYVVFKNAFFARSESDSLTSHQIFRTGLDDLQSEAIELTSKPNAIGVMDGDGIESVFVSHEHPDGHIILLNEEGEIKTNPFIGFQIVNRVQE